MQRPRFRCGVLIVALLAVGVLAGSAPADPDLTSLSDQVFVLVNQQRAARGLKPLIRVSPLDRSAQDFAGRMAVEDFFAHVAPDGSTPYDRIHGAGYQGFGWGENIAAGLDTAVEVMDAWMKSPGHAANILGADYTHIGIGVAVGGTYGIYWVQDFGSPSGPVPGPWKPRLDRLSPTAARPGDLVTLDGTDFGSPGGVTFNGVPAYIDRWGTHEVVARVPAGGGLGPVVVTNSYGASNGLAFGNPSPPTTPPAPSTPPSPPPPSTSPPSTTPPGSTPPSTTPPKSPGPSTPPSTTPPAVPPTTPATPPTSTTPAPPATPSTPSTPATPTPMPPPANPPPAPVTTPTTAPSPGPSTPPTLPSNGSPGPSTPSTPPSSGTPAPVPVVLTPAAGLRFYYLNPRNGASGTVAHLYGTGFGSTAGQIRMTGATATVLSWSDSEIVLRIDGPRPGRRGLRIIRADGHAGPMIAFRITP